MRVRVSAEELEMVQALADAEGISASDFVRLFIRRAYADRFDAMNKKSSKQR